MKNITIFLSENFQFLEVKLSIYLNRRVFVNDHNKSTALQQSVMNYWRLKITLWDPNIRSQLPEW